MSEREDAYFEFNQFLYHEARLMDESQYSDWLALWHSECLYWVPLNNEGEDPDNSISLIYENRGRLEDRIMRLNSKAALAQSPKSRLMRSISNIILTSASEDRLIGTSQFVCGEVRYDEQNVWFGRNEHELVRTPEGLKIAKKKVVLLKNDSTTGNLSFLI